MPIRVSTLITAIPQLEAEGGASLIVSFEYGGKPFDREVDRDTSGY
jgi:hypothetical protein